MKAKIWVAIFGVAWVVSECLLISRYDMDIMGILLLSAFGVGCAGFVAIGPLALRGKQKREVKSE